MFWWRGIRILRIVMQQEGKDIWYYVKLFGAINLGLVVVIHVILLVSVGGENETGLGFALGSMMAIGLQTSVNVLACILLAIMGKREMALGILASGFVSLIVGLSFCFGVGNYM